MRNTTGCNQIKINVRAYEERSVNYVVNEEFISIASHLYEKYPHAFKAPSTRKLCCVNLLTKEKASGQTALKLQKVRMPMALHCPYSWYVIIRSSDWAEWDEKKRMVVVAEVLMALPE